MSGFLFVADGARSARHETYGRCFEIFDGRNDEALADARERWRAFKEAGHALRYWSQGESGGWERKA
jgi:DNA polymerase-3 subunit chi